jgi:competence protein ComEA
MTDPDIFATRRDEPDSTDPDARYADAGDASSRAAARVHGSTGPPRSGPGGGWFAIRHALADRLPPAVRGGRLDPTIRGAVTIVVVVLAAAVIAGLLAWRARPTTVAAGGSIAGRVTAAPAATVAAGRSPTPDSLAPGAAASASPSRTPAPAEIVVDVAGKVRRPGVVRVGADARVVDAIDLAGGVLPGTDTTGLALARRLTDGEQILVTGIPGTAPAVAPVDPSAGGTGDAAGSATAGPVNLNLATEAQLDALPGVGPVLASRIIDWRTQHGPFTSPQQLGDVGGVGDKKLADLLPLVTV